MVVQTDCAPRTISSASKYPPRRKRMPAMESIIFGCTGFSTFFSRRTKSKSVDRRSKIALEIVRVSSTTRIKRKIELTAWGLINGIACMSMVNPSKATIPAVTPMCSKLPAKIPTIIPPRQTKIFSIVSRRSMSDLRYPSSA